MHAISFCYASLAVAKDNPENFWPEGNTNPDLWDAYSSLVQAWIWRAYLSLTAYVA